MGLGLTERYLVPGERRVVDAEAAVKLRALASRAAAGVEGSRSGPSRLRHDEHAGRVVYHETFGKGTILGSEGEGSGMKFTVRFATVGIKKVLGRYLLPDE